MLTLRKIQQVNYCLILIFVFNIIPNQATTQNLTNLGNRDPFNISGNIGVSTVFFAVDGRESNRQPFTYIFRGNPIISLYGIDIPISIVVSEQERDFRQPFNRFGISPYYKWATLHLGFQNLNYSRFSMAGHAMVGAGFEANPGKIRLGYMYGRLLKAVQPNTIIEDSEYFAIPSFQRTGQVFKLGYGNPNNFIDLIMLKASDDIQSLDSIPDTYGLQPAENAIVSIVTGQKIGDNLNIGIEYAQSSYTNDTRSEGESDSKGLFSLLSFLTDNKNTTELSSALEAFVDMNLDWFGTRIKLERISPNYRSMGAYFFLSDVQKITLEPRANIWNGKLSINTSLGFQKNNLSRQKSQQTNRSIGSVRINARITSFYSISGHFSNYGISQKEGLVPVSEDNFISQVTNNWGINQNIQFTGTSFMHNAIINFQRQQLTDDNPNTSLFTNYHNRTLFIIYNINYLPKQIGANFSYTHTKFTNQSLENTYSGPNIGVNISLLKKALRISLNQSFLTNVANGESQRRVDKLSLRASYKLNRQQKISLRTYFNKSKSFIETIDPFEETKIDLQYVYQFR